MRTHGVSLRDRRGSYTTGLYPLHHALFWGFAHKACSLQLCPHLLHVITGFEPLGLCRLMLDHLGLVNIGTAPGSLHRRLSDFRGYPPSHCCSQPAFNIQALPRHASSPVPSPLGLSKSICLTSLVLDIPRLPPQRVRPSLDCPPYARTHTELSHLWGLCPLERHLGRSPTAVPDRG